MWLPNFLLNNYVCTYKLMLLPILAKDSSFCVGQWWLQRLITVHGAKSEWLLTVELKTKHLPHHFQGLASIPESRRLQDLKDQREATWNVQFQVWHGHYIYESQKLWLWAQDLHRTGPVNTLSWKGECFMGPRPFLRIFMQLMVNGGGRKIFFHSH